MQGANIIPTGAEARADDIDAPTRRRDRCLTVIDVRDISRDATGNQIEVEAFWSVDF